ncbi:hypothetical protein PUT78_19330 [Roseinatronobacter sp. HJB301]|uniref:Uncharacterized protein n=1 Tax=Roseinatronobacter alkalisoli TaxID=3028235 RepID=A0ABT5TDQ9_9RHOB|nr:hypothetical protein [Roseinatronobacter sp. HJB301]
MMFSPRAANKARHNQTHGKSPATKGIAFRAYKRPNLLRLQVK